MHHKSELLKDSYKASHTQTHMCAHAQINKRKKNTHKKEKRPKHQTQKQIHLYPSRTPKPHTKTKKVE